MSHVEAEASVPCVVRVHTERVAAERGVRAATALTAVMMVAELVAGSITGSMALLADGWHMATHVGALGLSAAAYALSRRFASHRALGFGTGKVQALAGYTSAMGLGLVAVVMAVESVQRLRAPSVIDYAHSLPVAVLGLVVNVLSIALLHEPDDGHHHGPGSGAHDHNHRAAFAHVVADAFTSVLAIVALLAGRYAGLPWLDPVSGLVGAVVILRWAVGLVRQAAADLLDIDPGAVTESRIRDVLAADGDLRILDVHVWSLGLGRRGCIVSVSAPADRDAETLRARLHPLAIDHVTIEIRPGPSA